MPMTAEGVKASVRPIITYAFALGQIGLGFAWAHGGWTDAKDAFAGLSVFSMLIIRDYFTDRKDSEKVSAERESPPTVTLPVASVAVAPVVTALPEVVDGQK